MKRIIYILITTIFVLNALKVNAQSIPLPPDSTSYFISPVHGSVAGKIISYEHLTLANNFQIEAKCYFLDTATIYNLIWNLEDYYDLKRC